MRDSKITLRKKKKEQNQFKVDLNKTKTSNEPTAQKSALRSI